MSENKKNFKCLKTEIMAVGFDSESLSKHFNIQKGVKFIDYEDISNHKGDILIVMIDYLKDLYNELNDYCIFGGSRVDLYEFDRLNRYKFNDYKKVFLVSIDCFFKEFNYHFKSLYSNINFIDDFTPIDANVTNEDANISNTKKKNILRLKEYVDKQKDYFDSREIMKKFNVSNRWIKRYMYDMNKIYNNIGYSYSKRKWYKINVE